MWVCQSCVWKSLWNQFRICMLSNIRAKYVTNKRTAQNTQWLDVWCIHRLPAYQNAQMETECVGCDSVAKIMTSLSVFTIALIAFIDWRLQWCRRNKRILSVVKRCWVLRQRLEVVCSSSSGRRGWQMLSRMKQVSSADVSGVSAKCLWTCLAVFVRLLKCKVE